MLPFKYDKALKINHNRFIHGFGLGILVAVVGGGILPMGGILVTFGRGKLVASPRPEGLAVGGTVKNQFE